MSDLYKKAYETGKYLKRLDKDLKEIDEHLPKWIKILEEIYFSKPSSEYKSNKNLESNDGMCSYKNLKRAWDNYYN